MAGNIYFKIDGNVYTNSTDRWCGVKGTTFIYHGEWADPTVLYGGVEINANDLEEFCWSEYYCQCDEDGTQAILEDFRRLPRGWYANKLNEYILIFGN